MLVLTINPIDAWFMGRGLGMPVLFHRNYHHRGEIYLSCSDVQSKHIRHYAVLYEFDAGMLDPVEWTIHNPYAKTIFAKTTLEDVKKVKEGYLYQFGKIELLEEPILVEEMGIWMWEYDGDERSRRLNYPLSDEGVNDFYDLCQRLEQGLSIDNHPASFLLKDDFRARKERKDIIRCFAGKWVIARAPKHWKKVFAKRYGEEFVK